MDQQSCTCLNSHCFSSEGPTLSKEDKEALRQKELKQMKAKYGLQVTSSTQFSLNSLLVIDTDSHLCALL